MLKLYLQRERNSTTLAFMGRLLGSEKGLDTVYPVKENSGFLSLPGSGGGKCS